MGRAKRKPRIEEEPVINEFAARHGDYKSVMVVDLTGELSGKRQSTFRALRNQDVTHVDSWIAQRLDGFEVPQERAIAWMRSLWRRIGSSRVTMNWGEATGGSDADEGAAQSNALAEIALLRRRFPAPIWDAFENAVRWNEVPEDSRSGAYNYALHATGFVASMIALWQRF